MRKSIICLCSTIALTSSIAVAGDWDSDNNMTLDSQCNVSLSGQLTFKDSYFEVMSNDGSIVRIDEDYQVSVDGEMLVLSAQETENVIRYYESINQAVPMTITLVENGLYVANQAVTGVFAGLLGEDDPLVYETRELFEQVQKDVFSEFHNEDGAIVLNGHEWRSDGAARHHWENKFENQVENLVEKAIGRLMIKIGAAWLSGDEENDSMLARLENLDTEIEESIELYTDDIERDAEVLCTVLSEADEAENTLNESHAKLKGLNILSVSRG